MQMGNTGEWKSIVKCSNKQTSMVTISAAFSEKDQTLFDYCSYLKTVNIIGLFFFFVLCTVIPASLDELPNKQFASKYTNQTRYQGSVLGGITINEVCAKSSPKGAEPSK